jgi:hypothetical protein
MIYWVDAGVLIHAERGPYSRSMVPPFWHFIEVQASAGRIQMPRLAYQEITAAGYDDELAAWCKARKSKGLCVNESDELQGRYWEIAAYVQGKYKEHQIREFLKGADGWVIASALATEGVVVSSETERSIKSKIKIPTIAKVYDVRCLNTYDMLRELGFSTKTGR